MISESLIKQIRQLEIKTRRVVNATLSGEYHSVFKGQGINFEEVREYQVGDDVRQIDWNVTAKTGSPFVKLYSEERELTVYLVVDLSASMLFGTGLQSKKELAAEVAAALGFSAIKNNDRVGLLLFSNGSEKFIPPKKGKKHILRCLGELFAFTPTQKTTSIAKALEDLLRFSKKKAIVFLLSDFMGHDFEAPLKLLAKKHDLVPIVIEDPKEVNIPKMGIVPFEDMETGETMYIDTSAKKFQEKFDAISFNRKLARERLFKLMKVSPIILEVGKPYINPLLNYFKARSRR